MFYMNVHPLNLILNKSLEMSESTFIQFLIDYNDLTRITVSLNAV